MALRRSTLAVALAAGAFTTSLGASPAQDYTLYCMGCHGAQAQGVPGKIPPLADVQARRREVVRSLAATGAAPPTQY
jgi:cytochrome c553